MPKPESHKKSYLVKINASFKIMQIKLRPHYYSDLNFHTVISNVVLFLSN